MVEETIGGVPCPSDTCPNYKSLEWKSDYVKDDIGNIIGFCTKCGYHVITTPSIKIISEISLFCKIICDIIKSSYHNDIFP